MAEIWLSEPPLPLSNLLCAFFPFPKERMEGNHLEIVLKDQTPRMLLLWGYSSPGTGILWTWPCPPRQRHENGTLIFWASSWVWADAQLFRHCFLPVQQHLWGFLVRVHEPLAYAAENWIISLKRYCFLLLRKPPLSNFTLSSIIFKIFKMENTELVNFRSGLPW